MASNFRRLIQKDIGVAATTINGYDVPMSTQVTVIGLNIANTTSSPINVTVALANNGVVNATIVKNAPIPPGGALVVVGGDQKLVMMYQDSIQVTSSATASADAIMSILEVTP